MRYVAAMLMALTAFAADPAGFAIWRNSELKGKEKALAPKMDAKKVATETFANYGNHSIMAAHREGSGEAELHEKTVDISLIESGEAYIVVGGKIVNGRTTTPGETRGDSIEGGTRYKLTAGDMFHVPANIPHQMVLDPGQQVTYVIVKVSMP